MYELHVLGSAVDMLFLPSLKYHPALQRSVPGTATRTLA